jgi:hypothetical protein
VQQQMRWGHSFSKGLPAHGSWCHARGAITERLHHNRAQREGLNTQDEGKSPTDGQVGVCFRGNDKSRWHYTMARCLWSWCCCGFGFTATPSCQGSPVGPPASWLNHAVM